MAVSRQSPDYQTEEAKMAIGRSYFAWFAVTSIGLGVGFLAILQVIMLIEFGQISWEADIPEGGVAYLSRFVSLLVGGAVLGAFQAVFLRSYAIPVGPWIIATAVGFSALVVVIFPLLYLGQWGNIPGPAEPIITIVGGCSFAGMFQYVILKRNQIRAAKWLGVWIVSLIFALVPTALIFILLEGPLQISISWPVQVALSGFLIGGFAALFSGQAFLSALSGVAQATNRIHLSKTGVS
jgi:hypothetical protein